MACAAALGSIEAILDEGRLENAQLLEDLFVKRDSVFVRHRVDDQCRKEQHHHDYRNRKLQERLP